MVATGGTYLSKSRILYRDFICPLIHFEFQDYETRISAGLTGEGSECFGYDDGLSADHDYQLGLCLWLDRGTYEKIGASLGKRCREVTEGAADSLGIKTAAYMTPGFKDRRGVFETGLFFERLLGTDLISVMDSADDWKTELCAIREERLAAAVNGEIFRDDAGTVTALRRKLSAYYPEDVVRMRLAGELHAFSQNAQYNYPRQMARGDLTAASLHAAKGIESAMRIAFILNRRYRPHLKWLRRALGELIRLRDLGGILDEIAGQSLAAISRSVWAKTRYDSRLVIREDPVVSLFEEAAALIGAELREQGLTDGDVMPGFLDLAARKLSGGEIPPTIDQVIDLEWAMFHRVNNEGGRAFCQDDRQTFDVMRRSQFLTWSGEALRSYLRDLREAESAGRNLPAEKYGCMMVSTAPERYDEIKSRLPQLSDDRHLRQEAVIDRYVRWTEEMAGNYPALAGRERVIHTWEDTPYRTSFETYLRGELTTYSDRTFDLVEDFVREAGDNGINLAYETLKHTAELYGYPSPEAAEAAVRRTDGK